MRLVSIRVQNFRTLEDVTVRFIGFYTAISGQNNAGKTTLLRAIRHTFRDNSREIYFYRRRDEITYRDDRTQWAKKDEDITFTYVVSVSPTEDPGLFQFIERFNGEKLPEKDAQLKVLVSLKATDETLCSCFVNEKVNRPGN